MLTLSQMNPCGLSIIYGYTGCGKTTALRALIEEATDAPPAVIDLDQDNWTDPRPGVYYLSDITTLSQLKDTIVGLSPPVTTYFINGLTLLECPGTLFEALAELWILAKNRNIRIIGEIQFRRPPVGGPSYGHAVNPDGPTLFGVTDGFMFNLSPKDTPSF